AGGGNAKNKRGGHPPAILVLCEKRGRYRIDLDLRGGAHYFTIEYGDGGRAGGGACRDQEVHLRWGDVEQARGSVDAAAIIDLHGKSGDGCRRVLGGRLGDDGHEILSQRRADGIGGQVRARVTGGRDRVEGGDGNAAGIVLVDESAPVDEHGHLRE